MHQEQRSYLRVPAPFDLDVVLRGHGWVALAPHRYHRDEGRLHTVIDLAALGWPRGQVVDVVLEAAAPMPVGSARLRVRTRARQALGLAELAAIRTAIATSLNLQLDLAPFWQRCATLERLRWVPERGAGRLQRSPTLFEDLLKLLFTTNCTWANTVSMVERTCAALGRRGPAGVPAFPSARRCAGMDESFWREEVRVGYRAAHCVALAEGFASGELCTEHFDDPALSTAELRKRLLALPGFGPYAAGQALRLLGRFDDLALDSWVRKRAADLHRLPEGDDRAIARVYAEFDRYAGLALWMDVTREWHVADDESYV